MPNTRITKQKWKDHYSYAKKVYIIGIIVAVAVASLVYSVTRYVPANEHAVLIELVDGYVDTEKLKGDLPHLLAVGQAYDETLEQVEFLSINYTGEGNTENDYYGAQVYTVQVYAGDNDIYLQNEALTQAMIDQNFCIPLETLNGFDEFNALYPDVILWQPEPSPEDDDDEGEEAEPVTDPENPPVMHAYAIDVSSLMGFIERGAYDVRGKYAVIVATSLNMDTSFHMLTELFTYFGGTNEVLPAESETATPSEVVEDV